MSSDEFLSIPRPESAADVSLPTNLPDDIHAEDIPAKIRNTAGPGSASETNVDFPEIDKSFDTESRTAPRSKQLYEQSLQNALITARCADEMRGRDIVILDMTKIASIVDFFVIVTGTSRRQMHAIADEVNRKLKGEGRNQRLSVEGYRTEANWILMDFGDVVLHVFTEEGRSLYDLENLKADATRIDWQTV